MEALAELWDRIYWAQSSVLLSSMLVLVTIWQSTSRFRGNIRRMIARKLKR